MKSSFRGFDKVLKRVHSFNRIPVFFFTVFIHSGRPIINIFISPMVLWTPSLNIISSIGLGILKKMHVKVLIRYFRVKQDFSGLYGPPFFFVWLSVQTERM